MSPAVPAYRWLYAAPVLLVAALEFALMGILGQARWRGRIEGAPTPCWRFAAGGLLAWWWDMLPDWKKGDKAFGAKCYGIFIITVEKDGEVRDSVLRHEARHSYQIVRDGLAFAWIYATDWLREFRLRLPNQELDAAAFDAYWHLRYEADARECAKIPFEGWPA